MNRPALLAHLGRLGVDIRSTSTSVRTRPAKIQQGRILRSLRHRDDVKRVLWVAGAREAALSDAKEWRADYRWRMKTAADKALSLALLGFGAISLGAMLRYWEAFSGAKLYKP